MKRIVRIFGTRASGVAERKWKLFLHGPVMRMFIVAGLLFFTVTLPLFGQAPPSEQPADRDVVRRLIEQLDDSTRTNRLNAEKQLLKLGPAVLPLLPPPDLIDSVSAREAVRRLRLKLQRQKANDSVRPSQVTINGTQPLGKLIQKLARQSGNRIDTSQIPDARLSQMVTMEMANREFWPTLDLVLEEGGLSFQFAKNEATIVLVIPEKEAVTHATTYVGPIRIVLVSLQRREIFGNARDELLRAKLEVAIEPRLRPLFLNYAANDVSLKLSRPGEMPSIIPPLSPDSRIERPLGEGGCSSQLTLDFRAPRGQLGEKATLAGKFVMLAAAGTEQIVFRQLTKASGVARRRGGVNVLLKDVEVREANDSTHNVRIRVMVGYDATDRAFESHHTWVFHNKVAVEDSEGKRIEPMAGFQTTLQADGVVAVEYGFQSLPGDIDSYRFIYEAPTLIVDIPAEFQISNIPFPRPERTTP